MQFMLQRLERYEAYFARKYLRLARQRNAERERARRNREQLKKFKEVREKIRGKQERELREVQEKESGQQLVGMNARGMKPIHGVLDFDGVSENDVIQPKDQKSQDQKTEDQKTEDRNTHEQKMQNQINSIVIQDQNMQDESQNHQILIHQFQTEDPPHDQNLPLALTHDRNLPLRMATREEFKEPNEDINHHHHHHPGNHIDPDHGIWCSRSDMMIPDRETFGKQKLNQHDVDDCGNPNLKLNEHDLNHPVAVDYSSEPELKILQDRLNYMIRTNKVTIREDVEKVLDAECDGVWLSDTGGLVIEVQGELEIKFKCCSGGLVIEVQGEVTWT
jgi:hypothetical protein